MRNLNLAKVLSIAIDKVFASNLVSGSKQDQKLDLHPKVFRRATVKDYNSGEYASLKLRQTEVDGTDVIFI